MQPPFETKSAERIKSPGNIKLHKLSASMLICSKFDSMLVCSKF